MASIDIDGQGLEGIQAGGTIYIDKKAIQLWLTGHAERCDDAGKEFTVAGRVLRGLRKVIQESDFRPKPL